jgi:hypothetical protein
MSAKAEKPNPLNQNAYQPISRRKTKNNREESSPPPHEKEKMQEQK